jgi:hypothetical protein
MPREALLELLKLVRAGKDRARRFCYLRAVYRNCLAAEEAANAGSVDKAYESKIFE